MRSIFLSIVWSVVSSDPIYQLFLCELVFLSYITQGYRERGEWIALSFVIYIVLHFHKNKLDNLDFIVFYTNWEI